MLRMMSRLLIRLGCIALTLYPTSSLLADEPEVVSEESEALIERILELRGELERLLEGLSPELRSEVERRWLEGTIEAVEELPAPHLESVSPVVPAGAVVLEHDSPPSPDSVPGEAELPLDPPTVPEPVPPVSPEPVPVEPGPMPETRVEPVEPMPIPTPEPSPETLPESPGGVTRIPALTRPTAEEPPACGTLHLLDRNEDGIVDGSDRDWRYLYVLLGGRGSVMKRELQKDEVESLFEVGIRSLSVNLREWGGEQKTFGDIVADQTVRLILTRKHKGQDNGALVVDAGRLARSGEIRLVDTVTGEPLSGLRLFRPGVALEGLDGTRFPVPCP